MQGFELTRCTDLVEVAKNFTRKTTKIKEGRGERGKKTGKRNEIRNTTKTVKHLVTSGTLVCFGLTLTFLNSSRLISV